MANLENWTCYIAYAAGFAAGNFTGMILEEKIALGIEMIRVITQRRADKLISALKDNGFPVTTVNASGSYGEVSVLYVIVSRKHISQVLDLIREYNPRAFYTIEDIRFVSKTLPYSPDDKNFWDKTLMKDQ
jgi:uncharacterized protein YebE (UPF0316 family)